MLEIGPNLMQAILGIGGIIGAIVISYLVFKYFTD